MTLESRFDVIMTLLLRRVSAGKGLLFGYCYIQQHPQFDETQKSLSGGRLNKKDGLTRYGNSHVKDKTS